MSSSHRVVSLDALRGVSILLVIAYHVGTHFPDGVTDPVSMALREIGWAGVDIFFAISGFLITRILVSDSGWKHLRGFFVKRFFRIVPLYFVALAVYALASLVTGFEREIIGRLWINATFLTAWLIPLLGSNGIPYTLTWSVSVEESAYILFALISILSLGSFRRALVAIVVLAFLLRVWVVQTDAFPAILLYFFTPARLDVIALGGLAGLAPSLVTPNARNIAVVAALVVGTLVVFAVMGQSNPFVATIGYSVLGVAAAQLVALLARMPAAKPGWLVGTLARIGQVSYFVYLFHMFVIKLFSFVLPAQVSASLGYWPLLLLITAATYLAAALSWKYFEAPLIKLGHRIAGSRPAPQLGPLADAGPGEMFVASAQQDQRS